MTKRLLLLMTLVVGLLGASNFGGVSQVFAWHGGLNQPAEQCVEGTPRESFSGTVAPATGTWNVVVSRSGYAHTFPFHPNSNGTFSVSAELPVANGYTAKLTSNDDANAATNVVTFNVTVCYVPPTNTPVPPTNTATSTPVPPTNTATSTPIPPTNTPSSTPVPPTNTPTTTPTNTPVPPTNTPTNTPVPPTNTPTNTPVPPTNTPTDTPVPPTDTAVSEVQSARVVVKTQYRTVTKTQYRTVTKTRYRTITRYHDVTRTHTKVRTLVRYRTVVLTRHLTRVKQVVRVRTVVHHKIVYTSRVRYVTRVRYAVKVVIRHKTVVRTMTGYHFQQQPKTGRFAAPLAPAPTSRSAAIPPVEARLSIARLHIGWAPVWSRAFLANPDGSLRYDIVPAYGVTRFAASARLGQPGLTLMSGHDDVYGSIFRSLDHLQRGDVVALWEGKHVYHYVVRTVQVVTPDDVRLLNAPRTRPTLALISCTPYWVDTHRVVVIAEMQ